MSCKSMPNKAKFARDLYYVKTNAYAEFQVNTQCIESATA